MMMLMIQAMGNQPLSMDSVLPLLLMKENSEDDSSKFLIKIIVSGVNIWKNIQIILDYFHFNIILFSSAFDGYFKLDDWWAWFAIWLWLKLQHASSPSYERYFFRLRKKKFLTRKAYFLFSRLWWFWCWLQKEAEKYDGHDDDYAVTGIFYFLINEWNFYTCLGAKYENGTKHDAPAASDGRWFRQRKFDFHDDGEPK